MSLKDKPYWLKGGIYAIIITAVYSAFVFVNILLPIITAFFPLWEKIILFPLPLPLLFAIMGNSISFMPGSSFGLLHFVTIFVTAIIFYFIVGMIIGLVYGKIKSKKK
ncbi:MAG: hypothetical protein WC634_04755 [archaeon]